MNGDADLEERGTQESGKQELRCVHSPRTISTKKESQHLQPLAFLSHSVLASAYRITA